MVSKTKRVGMSVRRIALLSIVVGLLPVVAACGGVQNSTTPIAKTRDLEAVCTGSDFLGPKRTAFPDAAAYGGSTHPLVIIEHTGIDNPSSTNNWSKFSPAIRI
ncbi:hypothetical protein [Nocardia paucivorans]|uniref:hypothetical protein n=1 Tax=Nocardia paucivorans TaxID=114259 RepID=UPI0012FB33EC|nr:hypothetical protein [Nocardia paucivorans]